MICQICNNRPANVHMTKIINGVKNELHICEQCAREQGLEITPQISGYDVPFSFSSILAGLMDMGAGGGLTYAQQKQIKCQGCGLDYDDFKNTGRLGCSRCYETFGEKLEPLLKRIHGNTLHTGKVPKRTGGIIRIRKDIENLRNELKNAVENEQYEKAAEIRDRIKKLEGKKVIGKEVL